MFVLLQNLALRTGIALVAPSAEKLRVNRSARQTRDVSAMNDVTLVLASANLFVVATTIVEAAKSAKVLYVFWDVELILVVLQTELVLTTNV